MSRKEKRKELKKLKRKELRRQAALLSAEEVEEEEEDEEVVIRRQLEEVEALAKERAEHEEQERLWLLREEEAHKEWLRRQEEEAERKLKQEEWGLQLSENAEELEEGWEYVEDGPAEIIWQGNEIIVRKPKRKVKKAPNLGTEVIQDKDRPTSNPLPPQSTAFSTHQGNTEDGVEQTVNFGTEQDKKNCPFYIKTGVCRFGVRCNRLHPVFNEACTLLMRSMYTGAGLALEHVESLEGFTVLPLWRDGQLLRWHQWKEAAKFDYTDEEVAQEYEVFYDDVHSEFLQFGEIMNFKVCRNGSPHLRGNVYVHYLSQESAMAAYNQINGRFYAKKQISCEFVGVMKWRAAICGEYMRTNYKTCSRGTACNFLHCFENPHREYEWADWDRPPPRFWQKKMSKLYGHVHLSEEDSDENQKKGRSQRESSYDNDGRRHRNERESMYYDDRRKDRFTRGSARERYWRRDRDDRDLKYYEDERVDWDLRASKYDEQRRDRDLSEGDIHKRRRDKHAREPLVDDDQGRDKHAESSYNGRGKRERDVEEVARYKDRRRHSHQRESTYDDDGGDDDEDNRYSVRSLSVHSHLSPYNNGRSHHHRTRRRSRSPLSHKSRRSRSKDRTLSHTAVNQDECYFSGEELDGISLGRKRNVEGEKDLSSERYRPEEDSLSTRGGDYMDAAHKKPHTHEKREDEKVHERRKKPSRQNRRSYSENDNQQGVKTLESEDRSDHRSRDLDGTVPGLGVHSATDYKDDNSSTDLYPRSSRGKLEIQSGFKVGIDVESLTRQTICDLGNLVTGLSAPPIGDDVQNSTIQWRTWRKSKSKKSRHWVK